MTKPSDDHPRTIDEIVAALTSPARAEELQGEEALVDAIAAAVIANQPKELVPMTPRSRPLKIGLLAGAAVLSLAGVAAATTGILPDRKPTPPVISATTTTLDPTSTTTATLQGSATTIATATTAVSDQTTTVPDTSTTVSAGSSTPAVAAPPCPPDVQNHGQYVSDVARNTPPGPDHGKIVSAAAQSDCGKVATSDSGSPTLTTTSDNSSAGQHGPKGNGSSKSNSSSKGNSSGAKGRGRSHG